MAVAKKSADKWKMKQWFDVYAPKVISTEVIGSIPAADEKNVIGRIMKVSLSWITKNPNHAMAVIGLRVKDANGSVANTDVEYLSQQFSYLHSLVKRRADVVYTYNIAKSKDGNQIKFKLLITTRMRIAKRTKADLRGAIRDFVTEYSLAKNKEDIINELINGNFQAEGMKKLLPIAPVAKLEIKKVEF